MGKCVNCGTVLRHQTPFDLCSTCQKARLLYGIGKPKTQLKLYEVHVSEQITGTGTPHRFQEATLYVLGKSEPSTVISVRKWLQDELGGWTNRVQVTSIKELTGPFNHGDVIHYSEGIE